MYTIKSNSILFLFSLKLSEDVCLYILTCKKKNISLCWATRQFVSINQHYLAYPRVLQLSSCVKKNILTSLPASVINSRMYCLN